MGEGQACDLLKAQCVHDSWLLEGHAGLVSSNVITERARERGTALLSNRLLSHIEKIYMYVHQWLAKTPIQATAGQSEARL